MIYLPISLLEPEMILARDVPSSNPTLPLMISGQKLTRDSIKSAAARGIKGLYIEYGNSDDILGEEFLEPEQKQIILSGIKSEFDKIQRRNAEPDYRAITNMAESLVMSVLKKDGLLCNVLDIRDYDNYTYSHSLYVGIVSVVIGNHMNLSPSQLTDLATAGILHDIGKLDIPLSIINKPGPLTEKEYELIKEHPQRAVKRMWKISGCRDAILQGVSTHHENFDGSGYPLGISGTHIPLYGRILAIADVYDALSSNRSYRHAWTPSQVIEYITSRSDTQFDSELLPYFLHSVSAYPVGTLIKLSDGSIAMVIQNNPELILRPKIRLMNSSGQFQQELDLSKQAFNLTVLDILNESNGSFHL